MPGARRRPRGPLAPLLINPIRSEQAEFNGAEINGGRLNVRVKIAENGGGGGGAGGPAITVVKRDVSGGSIKVDNLRA